MANDAAKFVGSIPENYDKYLGPRIFVDYADDLARRVAALKPGSVLGARGRHRNPQPQAA